MTEPLDEQYFKWLYHKILSPRAQRTYYNLFRQLYKKEFVWIVPHDDNRIEDGRDLRFQFIDEVGLEDVDPDWIDIECSMLELLIVLSEEMSFLIEHPLDQCFWHFLDNIIPLALNDFSDHGYWSEKGVDRALDKVIWRTYDSSGKGGFFPLQDPHEDQRQVELWYQMQAYILENEIL